MPTTSEFMECAINWILNIFTDKRASKSDLNGTLALATTSVFLMERVHVRSGLEQICGNRNFIGIGCQMQFNERRIIWSLHLRLGLSRRHSLFFTLSLQVLQFIFTATFEFRMLILQLHFFSRDRNIFLGIFRLFITILCVTMEIFQLLQALRRLLLGLKIAASLSKQSLLILWE